MEYQSQTDINSMIIAFYFMTGCFVLATGAAVHYRLKYEWAMRYVRIGLEREQERLDKENAAQ